MKSMQNGFFIAFVVTLTYCGSSRPMLTSKDLTNTYETAKKTIAGLEIEIKELSQNAQQKLNLAIKKAGASIDQEYKTAQTKLIPLEKKQGSNAEQKILIIVRAAQEKINRAVYDIGIQARKLINQYEQQKSGKETGTISQESGKLARARAAHQLKMEQQFLKIEGILPAYDKALQRIDAIKRSLYGKPYDPIKMEQITQEFISIAQQVYDVYKNTGAIKADDSFNLVVIVLKNLSDMFNDFVFYQLKQLTNQKKSDEYFEALSQISTHILGTKKDSDNSLVRLGYDETVQGEVKKYFSKPLEQKKMFDYYVQKKINITYAIYSNALQALVAQVSNPTEAQRQYALAMYNLVMSELSMLSKSQKKADAIKSNNTAMALLFAASAQAAVKLLKMNKDNSKTITTIIDHYKQAAYYFSRAKDPNAAQYTKLSNNLEKAVASLKQAQAEEQSGNKIDAIKTYKMAQSQFNDGGDIVDANKIVILLADLQGKYLIDTVKKLFSQFASENKTMIQEYLSYIDTLDSSVTMNTFDPLFSSLIKLYETAYSDYAQALKGYQEVPAPQQTYDIIRDLEDSVSLLDTLSQVHTDLQAGDQILASKTMDALQRAEKYYGNVGALAQKTDAMYAKNSALNDLVPRYFMLGAAPTENRDLTTIVHRHIAKWEIVLANSLVNDLATALLYYNDANNQFNYLTTVVDNFLTTTLSSLSQAKTTISQLFQTAQATEKTLLALPTDAWTPKAGAVNYESDATSRWHALLHQYLTVYRLGYSVAKNAYNNAINEYTAAYKKFVPQNYYSELDSAMISYHQYVMDSNENEQAEGVIVLKDIEQLIMTNFGAVQKLVDNVARSSSITSTTIAEQKKIIQWTEEFDRALSQQEAVLNSVGQGLSATEIQQVRILDKVIDPKGTITYTYIPTKKTVIIPNPLVTLASLYKQIADSYFSKKNYAYAYPYYYYAKQTYLQAHEPTLATSFDALLARADSLYTAAQYRDLILPQNQVSVGTINVPESYLIKVYGQTIPADISNTAEFSSLGFLTTDPTKAQDFLVSLASKIYIYNKISDLFSADRFNELYALIALPYDQLQKNSLFQAFSDDEKVAFVSLVSNAAAFYKELTARVISHTTNLVLQQKNAQTFVLYEYSVQIPQFPNAVQFYQTYPSVITYYYYAGMFFQPGDPSETVGQSTLPPGNDPEEYAKMLTNQVNTYLSQGHTYRTQIDDIKVGKEWNTLKTSNKKDMALSIKDYVPLYSSLKDSFNSMITYYNGPLSNSLIPEKTAQGKMLTDLVGSSYKEMGDAFTTFLIGSPLSADYISVLKDIRENYNAAIVTYNFDSNLYGDLAHIFNGSGDILTAQGRYFDSISFFFTAVNLFQLIKPQNEQTKKWAEESNLKYFEAMFKGSTINMGKFENARKNPIEIILSDGSKITTTFNKLLEKYLTFLSQTGGVSAQSLDPEEKNKSDELKNLVLDALIFYSGCKTIIQDGIDGVQPSILTTLVPDEKALKKVEQDALDMIDTFTLRNKISLDTLDTVTLMLARTDFPDGADFTALLMNGFELFKKKVEQSTDNINKAIGYSGIAQLSLKLYGAFSYLYMDIYFGGISVDATKNLTAAITAEVNEIRSPSSQYI